MNINQNILPLIKTYYQLISLDNDRDKEKRWMAERVSFEWPRLTTLHLHVLAYIYQHPNTNGKSICCSMNILQGTLSKIINLLSEKDLVVIEKKTSDKRCRFYRTTARGDEISEVHEQLHQIKDLRMAEMLLKFSTDERKTIEKFLDNVLEVEKKQY